MEKYVGKIKYALIVLLIGTFLDMPYGYYQIVRIFGMIGFALLAYDAHKRNIVQEALIFGGSAILFNPMFKIAFNRSAWQMIDAVLIGIIVYGILKKNQKISS